MDVTADTKSTPLTTDTTKISELTVGELRYIIRDIISSELRYITIQCPPAQPLNPYYQKEFPEVWCKYEEPKC